MENHNHLAITPEFVFNAVLKWRWLILLPTMISLALGIYLAIKLPKKYVAETLILVEPQRVPANFVQSIVSTDIDARISTISQQIMSRTNLESIIKQFNLFADPKYDNVYLEDKLEDLRKRISVKVTRARRSADAFTIRYKGQDPQKVMKITNTLASYFINENLKVREEQAIGTSSFLDNELETVRKDLEKQEALLKQYRERYMGGLPEQLDSNLRILDRLQEELTARQEALRNARTRLALADQQLSGGQKTSGNGGASEVPPVSLDGPDADAARLDQLRQLLAGLLSRYTERHPDVVRTKSAIASLEKKLAAQQEDADASQTPSAASKTPVYQSLATRQLIASRDQARQDVAKLEQEITDLNRQITLYQKRVEDTPKREQELLSINRDYQNIKESYNSLLKRKLEAEISVNMEKRQKGEQFRILDPARLPAKPVEPNMKKLFVIFVGAGLAVGGGIAFLLEYVNTSYRKPEDIELALDIPVIGTIPTLYKPSALLLHKVDLVFSLVALVISLGLLAGLAALSFKGVDQTLALVRQMASL